MLAPPLGCFAMVVDEGGGENTLEGLNGGQMVDDLGLRGSLDGDDQLPGGSAAMDVDPDHGVEFARNAAHMLWPGVNHEAGDVVLVRHWAALGRGGT